MNKEIEDALHTLLHCSLKDTEYETQVEQYKIVRDYITDLQQENKQLKERIDKAIEFIKNNIDYAHIDLTIDGVVEDLLEILGDKE